MRTTILRENKNLRANFVTSALKAELDRLGYTCRRGWASGSRIGGVGQTTPRQLADDQELLIPGVGDEALASPHYGGEFGVRMTTQVENALLDNRTQQRPRPKGIQGLDEARSAGSREIAGPGQP